MPERPDALQRLRGAHEAAVLDELRRSGALSRGELMRRVGLSRTTLFAIVSDLLRREAVVEQQAPARQRGRGRPPTGITLNPRGAELIGIEVQRGRTHIVIVNSAHDIVGRHRARVAAEATPEERVDAITAAVSELLRERRLALAPLRGIGLGLPGFVQDPASTDPRSMTPFAAHIAAALERHFHAPVVVDNNARLAALAEVTWGAARGHGNAVYLRWSDGVGGGLVIDGRLVRGAHGTAGEIGHTSCDPAGPPCHCGGRGCLEGAIRVPVLLARCAERGTPVRDAEELLALAESGEPVVRTVLREAAALAGRVLAALAAQTDPECIMVDGEPAALDEPVLTTIGEQVRTLSLPTAPRDITVRRAALGEDAAARGAVALLLHSQAHDSEGPGSRPTPPSAAADAVLAAAEGGRR